MPSNQARAMTELQFRAANPNWFGDGGCCVTQWMEEINDEEERKYEAAAVAALKEQETG